MKAITQESENNVQSTMPGQAGPNLHRMIARVVGVLFLAAFLAYGGGTAVLASVLEAPDYLSTLDANVTQLRVGAILILLNSLVVATIGVLMLRVARPHGEVIAFGYLGARIVEAVLLAVGVVFLLLQIPLAREAAEAGAAGVASLQVLSSLSVQGNDFAYQIAMIGLGLGSVPFWYLFYRSRLVPRVLAAWGIAGYAIFAGGAVLEILGFEVGLVLSIPGGLFEMSLGIWLIVKGFTAPAPVSRSVHLDTPMAVAT